jgi:Uma2 family endonuclease
MATAPQDIRTTFEEFCDLIQDGQKADLIDGVVYMASPDNTAANLLNGWLYFLLSGYVDERQLGEVFLSRVAFRLDDHSGPEPDIAFVHKDHLSRVKRGHVLGNPDVAIEIVSPDSVDRDYQKKRLQYQQAGVQEYWILDELKKKETFLRLDARRQFRAVKPKKGEFQSEAIPGFWFRPEWLWQNPLPPRNNVLQQILSRSP